MKRLSSNILISLLIFALPSVVQALDIGYDNTSRGKNSFEICQTGRQKALKQRGLKVTRDKDDLIRRTIQAHGGDYVKNGNRVVLTLYGKIYSDFSLKIVTDRYLIIITPKDSFTLELADQ